MNEYCPACNYDYIQLLEARISALEALVTPSTSSKPLDSDDPEVMFAHARNMAKFDAGTF